MSRFFNETLKSEAGQKGVVTPASIDLQQAVDHLKKGIHVASPVEPATPAVFEPILGVLNQSNQVGSQVTTRRLEHCRKVVLPCDNEKSFLAAQYNPDMHLAAEAYRTLRTRLVKRQTESGTRSLVVSSPEGGEGKTLTALNLALCYANMQNWPVLLVDTDLRTRGLSHVLGDPETPGLAKVLESDVPYEHAILATNLPNLYILAAGTAVTSPPELFSRDCWKEFIGWCAESFRLVIIDSPPILGLADFELISAPCESILLVVRARKSEREAVTKMRQHMDASKVVGVVLNSITDPNNKKYYRYGYGYGDQEPTP